MKLELSLFTGSGGGLLGTKQLGFTPCGYVEWNEHCQKVIKQRIVDGVLEDAPVFGDIGAFIIMTGTPAHIRDWLISLQQDSHVSHLQQEDFSSGLRTKETDGQKPWSAFALFVPGGCYWKIPQGSLFTSISVRYSGAWPRSGTMRNGMCFQRACLVPHKHGKECSYWPTPTASMSKSGWGLSQTKERYRPGTTARCLQTGWAPSPEMLEAVQGWPIGWSALEPLEMDRYLSWCEMHGNF